MMTVKMHLYSVFYFAHPFPLISFYPTDILGTDILGKALLSHFTDEDTEE